MPVPNDRRGRNVRVVKKAVKKGSSGVKKVVIRRDSRLTEAVGSRTAKSRGALSPFAGTADKNTRKRIDELSQKTPRGIGSIAMKQLIQQGVTPEQFVKMFPKSVDAFTRNEFNRMHRNVQRINKDYADPAAQVIKDLVDKLNPSHYIDTGTDAIVSQVRVGGTRGSSKVVDRSEAMRKAWATRKKLYGPSGFKDK